MSLIGHWQFGKSIQEDGKFYHSYLFKTAIASPGVAGKWVDASQSTGTPKYNAYAGGATEATQFVGVGNSSIYLGGSYPAPSKKYLASWQALFTGIAPVPSFIKLCDYLLFYPLIDCDDDTQQDLANPVGLPRYADGRNVQMMIVGSVAGIANATCTITYTNSNGVSGRTTTFTYIFPTATAILSTSSGAAGSLGAESPFVPLANGDSGVRSVESIKFATPAGGFCTLVLVKPLHDIAVLETNIPTEKVFGFDVLQNPEIQTGAYLNMIMNQGAAQVGNLRCEFTFINT